MKRRLLFAFMAMCMSVSGFALSQGEFVNTPQGRFQITGANVATSTFADWTGWTVKGEGKTFADKFNVNANGYADGMNSISSMDAVEGVDGAYEGIYFKFVPTSADAVYVVSFKMKGASLDNVRCRPVTDGYKKTINLVKVAGHVIDHVDSIDNALIANTAEELTDQWQTFNYAIVGDGTPRTWFITLFCMATSIEIADLQIAPAMQFADLRQRDAMLEKLNAYKNCYEWPAEALAEYGYDEAIANLQAIGDDSGQGALDALLTETQEVLGEFIKTNMDDYLSTNKDNYLGIYDGEKNLQKLEYIGEWYGLPEKRIHWSVGYNPDLGHFGGNNSWCFNNPDNPIGILMKKSLDDGSYVFTIEAKSALREDPTSSSWTINEGWDPAYGVAYIVKIVDDVATDTIASVVKDLESLNYTPFVLSAKIAESGTYEIGFKAFCKDAYKTLANGSVVDVRNASIWGKNNNKYNQKQLAYEENVRTQIKAGRDNLNSAAGYLADENYAWGKDALKACADTIEIKIAAFEAMSQDEIIATYLEDTYENTTSNENGLLQYTVYQEATKWIIAANREFLAENDTLKSIQTAIEDAEAVMAMRLYEPATGKAALQDAIDKAKGVQTQMKAAQYSHENADAIKAAIEELSAAVEIFKTTIPASALATVVDIDFENNAVKNEETNLYSVAGAAGSMEFSVFSPTAAENNEFEKGFWSNGEQLWKGYIRVGNGTGTVNFDPKADNAADMGTNILRISCDFYVQGLSGRNLGFFVKDEADNNVCGLYRNYYDGKDDTNTFNADMSCVWAKSGGSYNDASPADVDEETRTANPLQKTHFEVIMDFGTNTQYVNISSPNGNYSSTPVELSGIPAKFILQSNYGVATRRPWFDNLKIERIAAGAPTGIATVKAANANNGAIFNLAGQRVGKDFKGLVIMNGKKMVVK